MPDNHISWDELAEELGFTRWRAEHPWLYRRIRFRMKLRRFVWLLTRCDIG